MDRDQLISSLFETQYEKLFKVGCRLIGHEQQAQDLVQSTFLLAILRHEEFARHPNREGWLMMTLKNLIYNEKRRHSRRDISLKELFDIAAPAAPNSLEELFPSRLPREDRDILMWRFEQRLDYRDIANILGISESGCRSRVARAVKRCRELFAEG